MINSFLSWSPWQIRLLLLAVTVVVYANSLDNSWHYDDRHSIVDNTAVHSVSNIGRIFSDPQAFSANPGSRMYRPILLMSYVANFGIGGDSLLGFHVVDIALHVLNGWLVWALARRVLGGHSTALLAALLFAVHPLLSEPVNYISSRSSTLATAFVLAAFLSLHDAARGGANWRQHLAVTVLAAAALGSKSIGIVLVPLCTVHLVMSRAPVRTWSLLLGPSLVAAVYVAATRAIIGKAVIDAPVRGFVAQTATQLKALAFYAYTSVVPTHLSVEPQFKVGDSLLSPEVLLSAFMVASVAVGALAALRLCPAAGFGVAWLGLALLPSSIVPLNVLVNEHRLYLPMVGGVIMAASIVAAARNLGGWIGPALILVLASITAVRNSDWATEERLWGDAVEKGPGMSRPYANLGKAYLEQERFDESIATSRLGLAINPRMERAHYNIGTAYLNSGRLEEAIASYQMALEINPNLLEAINNLGNAYKNQGRHQRALAQYDRALDLAPYHPLIHHNAGSAFLALGERDSAIARFRISIDRDPSERETHKGLVRSLRLDGQLDRAKQVLITALREWPGDEVLLQLMARTQMELGSLRGALTTLEKTGLSEIDARIRLGELLQGRKDWHGARQQFEVALALNPDDARGQNGLGETIYAAGDRMGALEYFRRAAALDPKFPDPFRNIGLVFVRAGRGVEAVAALERSVSLEGDEVSGKTWSLLAQAHVLQGDTEKARKAYRAAIAVDGDDAEHYHNLGLLEHEAGAWAEAERLYLAALERDPKISEARYNFGNLLLESGRYGEAVAEIEAVLQENPDRAEAYVNLASAYLNTGQGPRAIIAYETFLQKYGSGDELRRKVERQLRLLRDAEGM
ncbi:MAG: tetratricopeptide repeat protein [Candidatus Latescibacterota bacterium]|nr:tetratricopeptide repeat protein [Candidatus Latescibacterota bacterium]